MPLVSCPECSHQISELAASCPNCGAPRTPGQSGPLRMSAAPRWGRLGLTVGIVCAGAVAIFAASLPTQQQVHAAAALPTQATPPPEHHWSTKVGRMYAYKRELSEVDRQNGTMAQPMELVDYRGHPNGRHEFMITQGGPTGQFITCGDEACGYVTSMGMDGQRILPVEAGSILWAAVEDAKNGQFK